MNLFNSGQNLKVANVEVNPFPDRRHHRLSGAGRAVNREAQPDQVFDDPLDLLLRRGFLHGNNHKNAFGPWLRGRWSVTTPKAKS